MLPKVIKDRQANDWKWFLLLLELVNEDEPNHTVLCPELEYIYIYICEQKKKEKYQ
jgi:hypothetical protein